MRKPVGSKDLISIIMHYVYLIKSAQFPDHIYIGYTQNIQQRLVHHNNGTTFHTAKYAPWELVAQIGFPNKLSALEFERYLKSGTGRAFIKKRLLQR